MGNTVLKWDFKKHQYQLHSLPDEWDCPLYIIDMDEMINCASCGKKIPFGDGYTSRTIHTAGGFGYTVCADCHSAELLAEIAARKEK